MKLIYLIGGLKQHGKDTFADEVKDYLELGKNIPCARESYASTMKDILIDLGIITREQAYKSDKTELTTIRKCDIRKDIQNQVAGEFLNVRETLQLYGTEIMKKYLGEDVWVKAMAEKILRNKESLVYIISDYRFHGLESDHLKELVSREHKSTDLRSTYIIREGMKENKDNHDSENSLSSHQCDDVKTAYTLEDVRENAIEAGEQLLDILARME